MAVGTGLHLPKMSAGRRNPKSEGRKPKEIRNPKFEATKPQPSDTVPAGLEDGELGRSGSARFDGDKGSSGFGLRTSDFLRVSDFGLRIWQPESTDDVEEAGI
jgi:hypothetical protein